MTRTPERTNYLWRRSRSVSSNPTSGSPGSVIFRTDLGDFFQWDATRSKWLSLSSTVVTFSSNAIAAGVYMDYHGLVCTAAFGYRVLRPNVTIVGWQVLQLTVAVGTNTWRIIKNGGAIAQLTITNPALSVETSTTNLDMANGNILAGFYLSGPSPKPQTFLNVFLREKAA